MAADAGKPSLAEFIRREQAQILEEWERRVRALSPARRLTARTLRNHLPQVIGRIAEMAEALGAGSVALAEDEPEQHAVDRLQEGYDLADVVREYSLLREIMLDASERAGVPGMAELRMLNRVLDHATEVAVSRFAHASERLLKALDRISTEAIGQQGVDALLVRLLDVMREASPAVDEATILLRDDDHLTVRAAVGVLENREHGFRVAVGEGFAGGIAAEGKPRLVRDAGREPSIRSQVLRASGIRGLYGVPLFDDARVIGVAHIGSCTAYEFSDEDVLLFRAMANRATAFIVQERLREEERRVRGELQAVLESIPDGVYVGDADGVRMVNREGRRLMGVSSDADLQLPTAELMRRGALRDANTGTPLALDDLAWTRAQRGETVDTEVALDRLDTGEEIIVRSVAAPLREGDRIVGVVAVNTDITARKRAERELRLEAEYRERFVGILGHDLRTPVAAISFAASLLLRRADLPERVSRMVRRILSSTERIEHMIRDLLDFTRARTGRLPLEPIAMDLYTTTHAVIDELALAHPEREIALRAQGDTRGRWDRERLGQMVSNLVSNALEYSRPSSTVKVELDGSGDQVELRISNEGEPIPAAMLPHLFEPFRRGEAAEAHPRAGLGLGLFIVRSIVEAHGGTIAVSSERQRNTFTVRLPRSADEGQVPLPQ